MGKLTATRLKSLTEPGRYSDGDGLFLEVKAAGGRNWILRAQCGGKRRDIGLGSLKSVDLKDAREAAYKIRRQIAQGLDPVLERKRERRLVPSFRDAARIVHAEHKPGWKNGKHQNQWLSTLEAYAFPKIGDRLVSDIGAPEIRDVLAPIWLSKPETARRVRQRIGTVLDWGLRQGISGERSPAPISLERVTASAKKRPTFRGHGLRRHPQIHRSIKRARIDR